MALCLSQRALQPLTLPGGAPRQDGALRCGKLRPFKAPEGLSLLPGEEVGLGHFDAVWFSRNTHLVSFKQQSNLKSLSVWSQCLKGIADMLLALGRKTILTVQN